MSNPFIIWQPIEALIDSLEVLYDEDTAAYDEYDEQYEDEWGGWDDSDYLEEDTTMTNTEITNKQWKIFQPGTPVAWRESLIFGGRVHYGEVKSVQFAQNGYPVTTVQFPTYREGQPREWAVEALATPDQYEDAPSYWAV